MSFELNNMVTPIVTIFSIWLGARSALGNDIHKKSLELEIDRLERLAVECDNCLSNLNLYCLRVARLLNDLSENYNVKVTLAELTLGLKKSEETGISLNTDFARIFQNNLELHRNSDFQCWKKVILPLLKHLDNVIASPSLASSDCIDELSRQFWAPEQVRLYNHKLAILAQPIPEFRRQLFKSIADDYRKILHPEPVNFWRLHKKIRHSFNNFFRKPTVS